jgi:hypothetical protein
MLASLGRENGTGIRKKCLRGILPRQSEARVSPKESFDVEGKILRIIGGLDSFPKMLRGPYGP